MRIVSRETLYHRIVLQARRQLRGLSIAQNALKTGCFRERLASRASFYYNINAAFRQAACFCFACVCFAKAEHRKSKREYAMGFGLNGGAVLFYGQEDSVEKKPTKRLSWMAVLLIVAVLCTGSFLLARWIVDVRQPVLRNATELTALPGQNIKPLGSGVLYHDGTTLHALNARGQQTWTYTAGVGADFSIGLGGVATWTDTTLSLLDVNGKTLFSGNLDQPILHAYLGTEYAAVQTGAEHDSIMLLMETGGRQVMEIDLPSLTVLDFGFFSGGTLFWVMTMNTEGTIPICQISTYRPGKMLAGTVQDSEQILYRVMFQSSQIRAVGSTYLRSYDYTGKELTQYRKLVYGWYLMGVEDDVDNPLMAFVPSGSSGGVSDVSDVRLIRGDVDETIRLPVPCFRLFTKGDQLYAFSNQYVLVYRLGDTKPAAYRLPMVIESVVGVADGNAAIVTSGNAVYLVPLP